jgi:hypothetical protein
MKVRSFPLSIFSGGTTSSAFSNGLRPKEELSQNPAYLSQATNIYLSEDGCFDAEKFTRTFALDEDAQIFPTYKGVFVLTKDTLYGYENAILTQLLTGLIKGGLWSVADFGDYILFTNGEVNLVRNPTTGIFTTDNGTVFPLARCICAHRGRLILGGPKKYPTLSGDHSNWVAWSDINNLKFVSSAELDQARQNLSGYMPMPWQGDVLRVATMGDKVIAYGDNGITALSLASTTYGQIPVYDVGIQSQGAMTTNGKADDGAIHYFVDKTGWLYKMAGNLEIDRLGYKEFLN